MPQLVIEQPGVQPITVSLSDGTITFGRAEDNDVVLTADEVSRRHASITGRGSQFILRDLQSLNGTWVNRERIVEQALKHLDEIWFGSKCRILYRNDTVYGVAEKTQRDPSAQRDSDIEQSIDSIRAEMEQIGTHMTLIGSRTPRPDTVSRQVTAPSPDEIVRMSRAYRRLAALYKVNQVITADFDLQERLADVLDTIMEVLQANRGFVLLREPKTQTLRIVVARQMGHALNASSPSMGIADRAAIGGEAVLMSDRDSDREFGGRESIIVNRINSAMAVPLHVENRILGSIYVDTDAPDTRFDEEDLELFASLGAQAAMAVDIVRLHDQVLDTEKRRQNLARFLPGALVEKIMSESQTLALGGKKAQVTTLFCDIRGSSQIAEQLMPQTLVTLLNEHFTAMTEILFAYEGTLDKYIGDEIMAVFGAPILVGDEPYRAVCAAMDMQRRNAELNAVRASQHRPQLQFGIGIESGEVIAGYIGSPKRMDFTVVGDRVNVAKRFCDMAGAGKIVVGEQTWDAVKERIEAVPMGVLTLKGKQHTVQAFEISGERK